MSDIEFPSFERHRYDTWPDVLLETMSEEDRRAFNDRKQAVMLKCDGAKNSQIKLLTGFDRREVFRYLKRCECTHHDGRAWGFRALVPGTKVDLPKQKKQRKTPKSNKNNRGGLKNAFTWLLNKYPDIRELIINLFTARALKGELAEKKMLKKYIHLEILKALRAKGLGDNDYPFFIKSKGIRSLEKFLETLYDAHFKEIISDREGKQAARNLGSGKMGMEPEASRPNEQMEIDAHQLNGRFKVTFSLGKYPSYAETILRPWLLVLLCRYTRVIWAYLLVFKEEINHLDILRLLKRFVHPSIRPELPDDCLLKYIDGAGLPSELFPECHYALADEFYLDNALAHTATETRRVITEEPLGGTLITGRFMAPNDRPYIERLFSEFERHSVERLANTTGNSPDDSRRDDPDEAVRLYNMDESQAHLIVGTEIRNYNARRHSELGRSSPLAMLQHNLSGGLPLRMLLDPRGLAALNLTKEVTVRGGKQEGRRPYIRYEHVRYSSESLRKTPSLAGQKFILSIDFDDLSSIRAYLMDGTFFDILIPMDRKWRKPHTYEDRKRFYRHIGVEEIDDGFHAYATGLKSRTKQAPSSKKVTAVAVSKPDKASPMAFKPLSDRYSDTDYRGHNG